MNRVAKEAKSEAYFGLIRNYYRFGWLIPYFFGASPAICHTFLQGKESQLPFEEIDCTLYLPKATSLRLSDLGYTNSAQSALKIGFNSLEQYLDGLNKAIHTPSKEFAKIGVKVDGAYRQLNDYVLQIENELYAPIRPKRVAQSGEKPSEALARGGVEYIEVRSLDVNPFSPIGITAEQIRFLDLFLTWCVLQDSAPMDDCELECWRENWNKVIADGRQVGLQLQIGCNGEVLDSQTWVKRVFTDLRAIAQQMDLAHGGNEYMAVCDLLESWNDNPELSISGQLLEKTKQAGGLANLGKELGREYRQQNLLQPYHFYSSDEMESEVIRSVEVQKAIEAADTVNFDDFLTGYFAYLNRAEQ